MKTINYPFAGLFEECAFHLINTDAVPFTVEAVKINTDLFAKDIAARIGEAGFQELELGEGRLTIMVDVQSTEDEIEGTEDESTGYNCKTKITNNIEALSAYWDGEEIALVDYCDIELAHTVDSECELNF